MFSWSSGAYIAWVSLFDGLLFRDSTYSEKYIGLLSCCSNLGYIAGGSISSWFVDKFLRGRQKNVLWVGSFASILMAGLFILYLPPSVNTTHRFRWLQRGFNMRDGQRLLLAMGTGVPNGICDPIFYELAAEITHPISEGASAVLLALGEAVGTVILLQMANHCAPEDLNTLFMVGIFASVGLLFFVRAEYRRTTAEHRVSLALSTNLSEMTLSPGSTPRCTPSPFNYSNVDPKSPIISADYEGTLRSPLNLSDYL
mmetsp:Transcript_37542/g.66904  ORF Transcript_37542/g.66904 Transcript_37542/m.66904 type:complete len:256 (-) Transcript_37542:363-1130(-)